MTEPWLRGPIADLHPVAAHLIYTFTQAREELALRPMDVWAPVGPIAPVGFHLAHIAGSVNRLTTYLRGEQLTPEQMARLQAESTPGPTWAELLAAMEVEFAATEALVRTISPETYPEPRYVGRKRLPTTAGGLIIHMAEHTQRHTGQALLTVKLALAASDSY
ncbi:MAG: DinB family protein [Bryobacteraceae bacterium]|nr:DinB family protein [Bryobacteraceae bacterium]